MLYYFLESQSPRSGFISGGTTFTPPLTVNYLAMEDRLPEGTIAEVQLLSSVRRLKADYFETTTGPSPSSRPLFMRSARRTS